MKMLASRKLSIWLLQAGDRDTCILFVGRKALNETYWDCGGSKRVGIGMGSISLKSDWGLFLDVLLTQPKAHNAWKVSSFQFRTASRLHDQS